MFCALDVRDGLSRAIMLALRAAYILEEIEILLALPICHLIVMLCV